MRKQKLAQEYFELLEESRKAKGDYITPRVLKREVEKVADQFSGYGQQDAQEFKNFLLDGIHNELNRVTEKPPY